MWWKQGLSHQVIAGWRKNQDIKFRKVQAHPERRKHESNWTDQEKGNYLADQVAGGVVEPMFTINASEWLLRIGASSKIIIANAHGIPVIGDIRSVKSKIDTSNYLRDRDLYRAKDGKPPLWVGANLALHHKLMGHVSKIGDRVITQRIGLLKRWQWLAARSNNTCQGCLQPVTDVSHPIRHCRANEIIAVRDKLWKDVEAAIMRSPRANHSFLFDLVNHIRTKSRGDIACCGTFVPEFVSQLTSSDTLLDDNLTRSLTKVLRVIALGTRLLLRTAAEVQLGQIGINWRQTGIKEHFKPSLLAERLQTPQNVVVPSNDRIAKLIAGPKSSTLKKSGSSKKYSNNYKIKRITLNPNDYDIDFTMNKNLNISDIFDCKPLDDGIYWELKAG